MSITDGFAEAITQTLADGRALAEARMDSVCRIFYESGGRGPQDPDTKVRPPLLADRISSTPCRVGAGRDTTAHQTTPGDALGAKVAREVSIPADSPVVKVGDFLQLTTTGPLTDPTLAGIRFRVVDAGQVSQSTARRLKVEVDL
jgi:hypothetical protein